VAEAGRGLHRLSQRHEQLAHECRRRAHHAEQMAEFFDGTGTWPKPPLTKFGK
jgi:hypothetical protein